MYFIIAVVYLLILKLFLAGKDATSFLLKDNDRNDTLTHNRIKRWHRDGVAIDILSSIPIARDFGQDWWQIALVSLLWRLGVYDMAFNHWGKLDVKYLGSTATFDRIFAKIFGQYGAVRKSLFFISVLVLFIILKYIFHL